MREVFIESTGRMLDNNPDSVVVLADWFINVGIVTKNLKIAPGARKCIRIYLLSRDVDDFKLLARIRATMER